MAGGSPGSACFDLPAGALKVSVVDADGGAPITGALVAGRPEDREALLHRFEGAAYRAGWGDLTGKDGRALLRALPTDLPVRVTVTLPGYRSATVKDVTVTDVSSPAELTVRLRRAR